MTEEQEPIVLTCLNPWCTAPDQMFIQRTIDQFHCTPACRRRKNGRDKRKRDKQKAADIVKGLEQIIAAKDEKIESLEQIIADQAAEIHRLRNENARRSL